MPCANQAKKPGVNYNDYHKEAKILWDNSLEKINYDSNKIEQKTYCKLIKRKGPWKETKKIYITKPSAEHLLSNFLALLKLEGKIN